MPNAAAEPIQVGALTVRFHVDADESGGSVSIPQCVECHQLWLPTDAERWQAHWVGDGPEEKLVFYCTHCAEREFSDD